MKPDQLREARKRAAEHRADREKRLEEWVRGQNALDVVNADLIPTMEDFREAVDQMNLTLRKLERKPTGTARDVKRRDRLKDEVLVRMATVVVFERVVDLDPIERAGLTPARLVSMSAVGPEDIEYLRDRLTRPGATVARPALLVPEGSV